MKVSEKIAIRANAKDISRWFSIEIKIRVFGKTIWHMVFPPNSQITEEDE